MKRKMLAMLLTIALALSLLSLTALAADAPTSGTCGDGVYWTLEDGVLTISGTGEMYNYDSFSYGVQAPWYSQKDSITAVIIMDGVTIIGDHAFAYCYSLTSVTFPDSVTSIGDYAFAHCDSLTSVMFPDSVIRIGDSAFWGCDSLTSIDLSDSVTSISDRAFADTGLTNVTIPAGVTSIEANAFAANYQLVSITAVENNSSFCGIDGVLFSKDLSTLVVYPAGKTDTTYTIPASVAEIGPGAFNNSQLTQLTIPSNVKTIGHGAFWMSHFTSVTMEGVITIGYQAFGACYDLTRVTLPNTLKFIGWNAFYANSVSGEEETEEIYYAGTEEQWEQIVFETYDYDSETEEYIFGETSYAEGGREAAWLYDAVIYYGNEGLGEGENDDNKPVIVPEATDSTYVLESGGTITIYCTGELSEFIRLFVDGQEVDPENYLLEEGSTIVTLISAYLDTLGVGQHTVELEFTSGTARTTITILERGSQTQDQESDKPLDSTPKTDDNSMLTVWVVLALVSLAGMGAAVVYGRKFRRHGDF